MTSKNRPTWDDSNRRRYPLRGIELCLNCNGKSALTNTSFSFSDTNCGKCESETDIESSLAICYIIGKALGRRETVAAVSDRKYVGIWGGDRTEIENYPFIASVQFKRVHTCAGIVVSDLFILTTASCFDALGSEANEYSIVVGTSNLEEGGVAYDVARVIRQNEYPASRDHDIALLKLVKPLKLSIKVAIASLAPEGLILKDDAVFNVTGWGPDADHIEGILKTTKVHSINRDACSSRNGDEFRVTKYLICAGSNGHGPCMCLMCSEYLRAYGACRVTPGQVPGVKGN
ncbi:Trypsin [Eumeta japonica]|uniref:Trypsin n=1 Tax=Eumeta variegata TaxID=151549 RepID=A0A4C1W9W1_EUMVA|nr:Trypsin [Eumeta japonica]